jgi:hypothetical protein
MPKRLWALASNPYTPNPTDLKAVPVTAFFFPKQEDTYLEITECTVYLYNDEGVWGAMEVVCENDNFYWSY